ncbi:hypothetical protein CMK12_00105 [Candidatus Poribacteria bacterium]|nr:hypothetical protein [Candidatus Poribacteria bacterium]
MANSTEMKRLLTSLLLAIVVTLPIKAEKWALLVGINDYPNDISPLRYCVADVEAFRQALINVAGFKEDKIFLMTDQMRGQMEPTNINVVMRLDILASQIKADDTFVFYFSGHGIAREDQSFLLAANSVTATANTLELSAIPLDRISKILSTVKAQQLLTVIDACRNNPEASRSGQDNLLSDNFTRGFKIRRSNSNSGTPSVSATLYACNVGERAYEWADKGHGVFSYYLLEGLNGEAVNSQGEVTVTTLAEYTQGKVVKWAEEFRGKKQTPWLSLQGGAKLVLATLSQPVDPTLALTAESETWQVVKDSRDITDFEAFLDKFPNGDYALAAKLKLKQLRPKKITWRKDESEMVLIPAGSFEMGDHLDGMKKALPVHTVELDSFYMDKYEVTVGQFKKFVEKSGYAYQGNWNSVAQYSPGDDYPMVYVTWNDAVAYAKWTRKRLPTEAEWEYAARGGLVGKRYPRGDEISHDDANYSGTGGKDKWSKCAPVGSFAANGYGLYDMAGNVREWCQDWYGENYYSSSPAKNPPGPGSGSSRVLRGGYWNYSTYALRVATRVNNFPKSRNYYVGFRCVSGSN